MERNGKRYFLQLFVHFVPCFLPAFVDQNLSCFNSQIVSKERIPGPFAINTMPGVAPLRGLHLHQHKTRHNAE